MRGVVVLLAVSVGAEPLPLSLKKAVEIALAPAGSARVQLAREAIAQAKARQSQARASLLPSVDGAMTGQNFTRNLKAFGIAFPAVPGFRPADVVGPITNFDVRVHAAFTVFDYAAWKRLDTARHGAHGDRGGRG